MNDCEKEQRETGLPRETHFLERGPTKLVTERDNEMMMRCREAARIREAFQTGKAQRQRARMLRKRKREDRKLKRSFCIIRQSMQGSRHTTPWIAIPQKMKEKMTLGREAASAGKIVGIVRRSRECSNLHMPNSLSSFEKGVRIARHVSMLAHINKDSPTYKRLTVQWRRAESKSPQSILEFPFQEHDASTIVEGPDPLDISFEPETIKVNLVALSGLRSALIAGGC